MVGQVKGNWTPVLSCDTPTGLSVTTGNAGNVIKGRYIRTGDLVVVKYRFNAQVDYTGSTSGKIWLSGLPWAAENIADTQNTGSLTFQCLNAVPSPGVEFTQLGSLLFGGESKLRFFACAQGLPEIALEIGNINNGQPVVLLEGTHSYITDAAFPS